MLENDAQPFAQGSCALGCDAEPAIVRTPADPAVGKHRIGDRRAPLLSETPASLAYVGGALCLAGIGLTRRR